MEHRLMHYFWMWCMRIGSPMIHLLNHDIHSRLFKASLLQFALLTWVFSVHIHQIYNTFSSSFQSLDTLNSEKCTLFYMDSNVWLVQFMTVFFGTAINAEKWSTIITEKKGGILNICIFIEVECCQLLSTTDETIF